LMWRYFELLSFRKISELEQLKIDAAGGMNPRDIKFMLASEIVERFHSGSDARNAKNEFVNRFQKGEMPASIVEKVIKSSGEEMPIAKVIKEAGLVASTSEALRMLEQGAVRIDGERVTDRDRKIGIGNAGIFQVGKRRFARIRVT